MLAQVTSFALIGLVSTLVDVEVDISRGLPSQTIVGLPEAERWTTSLSNVCGAPSSTRTSISRTMLLSRTWKWDCRPTSVSTIMNVCTRAWTIARRQRCPMREQFLTTLPMLDMRRDQRHNVPGGEQFLPGQSAGPHLILADPWSKEWG